MSQTTVNAYRFDKHGYLLGSDLVLEGQVPPDDTLVEPATKKGYWCKWDGEKWNDEKIPTTASELLDVKVEHSDNTLHANEVRALMNTLCTEDSGYQVTIDEDLTMFVELIPTKTFDELKTEKLSKLHSESSKFQSWNCSDMYIKSSLGITVNADQCSQNNIAVLIEMLPDDEKTTSFKLFDNSFKDLNRVELQTLLSECHKNGLALYQQKFAIQAEIVKATTKEELDAIVIDFVNADYSL